MRWVLTTKRCTQVSRVWPMRLTRPQRLRLHRRVQQRLPSTTCCASAHSKHVSQEKDRQRKLQA